MKNKSLIILLIVALLSMMSLSLGACKEEDDEPSANPLVVIELVSGENIRLELYPEIAPITVENFLQYAEDGYYTGTVFHRVIADFMMQGGGFSLRNENLVQKKPTYDPIFGEFADNGFENPLKHEPGVISMARTSDVNSATSQFFICTEMSSEQQKLLDGHYAAFGRVTDSASLNVVKRLTAVQTGTYQDDYLGNFLDFPATPITIANVTVKR